MFKAKVDYMLRAMFEDKTPEDIRKEVAEKYGVTEESLIIRGKGKGSKESKTEEEIDLEKEDEEIMSSDLEIDLEDEEGKKVVNITDYKDVYDDSNTNNNHSNNNTNVKNHNKDFETKDERTQQRAYKVKEQDDERLKRFAKVIKEDFNDFTGIYVKPHYTEEDPFNLSIVVSNPETKVRLIFGLYYIYDAGRKIFLYQQGDSREETKKDVLRVIGKDVEMRYVLERYLIAMRLNNKID